MLSFIYDFLQMIAPTVSTFVETIKGGFSAISDVSPWVSDYVQNSGFPDFAIALIGLLGALALFDKILGVF